jgi:hypothetical protein
MPNYVFEDAFPNSPAYLELVPLRVPAGWTIGWNQLYVGLDPASGTLGGSSEFHASNPGRRFAIDVEFRPEFDPAGAFHLTVIYQPWPRTERGRRRNEAPFAFDAAAEEVHRFETRDYAALIAQLEYWIAKCSVWVREGH